MTTLATYPDMLLRYREDALAQLTDADTPVREMVEMALADANSEVMSYLGRYRHPMMPVPPILQRIVCDFAYEYLLNISHQHLNDELNDTRKSHEAYLTRLADGIVALDLPLAEGDDNTASGEVEFTASSGRIFGRTKR